MMRRMAWTRLGRRGAMLLTLGTAYLFIGASMVYRPDLPLPGIEHLIPVPVRVGVWSVFGAAACVGAFTRRDKWAWLALYLPPSLRVLYFGVGCMAWLLSGGDYGSPLAWIPALGQVPLIVAVVICSGWREHEPLDALPPPPPDAGR